MESMAEDKQIIGELVVEDKAQDDTKRHNPKKDLFIDTYRKTYGHISNTCSAVGIGRKTYYNWLEDDEDFRQEVFEAELELNDDIREVLIQKAADGDMKAVVFYLKKRHPDFRDTPQMLVQNNLSMTDEQLNRIIS